MGNKQKVVVFDLDDTLYKEIDFLKSAFKEIADYLTHKYGITDVWCEMMQFYHEGKDIFQGVINRYQLIEGKQGLIDMYRQHKPDICLDGPTLDVLRTLKTDYNCNLGIITDGRSVTQRNKIEALGLYSYVQPEAIFISEECGHEKIDVYSFEQIERLFPCCDYIYVGDNPAKDFIVPNKLGWDTICLIDNGQNIHQQDFNLAQDKLPKHVIKDITELLINVSNGCHGCSVVRTS